MQTGRKIALLRQSAGLTQEQLAEKLFVSRELVSKWETDKRRPDFAATEKLAALFGVGTDEFKDGARELSDELAGCFPDGRELSEKETAAVINAFLETLTKKERLIFISRYYHNHPSVVTAEKLGLKEGYVRKRLVIIRNKLTEFAGGTK